MLAVVIRIGLFVMSWLTCFFIPKNEFKKFTPVAIFASFIVVTESMLAIPFNWWKVKGGILNKVFNDLSLIFGPFFVGTIWIFRFTYGKFWLYTLTNILMDLILAYPINWFMQKLKIYKLVNFRSKHVFYTAICYAFVIYGYQIYISRIKSSY